MTHYPLIISTPHACTTVNEEIKERLLLTDYQIWKFADPFTEETCFHPKAFFHNIGNIHRLCCDLSLGTPPARPFRTHDYYGAPIYKEGKEFTQEERQHFLNHYIKPFRENIINAISDLVKKGYKKILFVDHHNTAGEHTVGKTGKYMPVITICNGGEDILSCPFEFLETFKESFEDKLNLPAEINYVYSMSHTITWLLDAVRPQFPDIDLYGLFLEYNLSFIHNPISKNNDLIAMESIHKAINSGIDAIFQKHF